MNSEVKQKWIEVLRSDKYEQHYQQLRGNGNRRCCLGVLCDIYKKEHEKAHWNGQQFFDGINTDMVKLPPKVISWAGMDNPSGSKIPIDENEEYEGVTLADFNDGFVAAGVERHSFDEIADLIEKHL